jgi:hypothetical protein
LLVHTANTINIDVHNDTHSDDDGINWKVIGGHHTETPLRQANTTVKGHFSTAANAVEGGGVISTVNSGTIEVRFMIDPERFREFNLCLRLREFIIEERAMDPAISILPLSENGGENITKVEERSNIKEG